MMDVSKKLESMHTDSKGSKGGGALATAKVRVASIENDDVYRLARGRFDSKRWGKASFSWNRCSVSLHSWLF